MLLSISVIAAKKNSAISVEYLPEANYFSEIENLKDDIVQRVNMIYERLDENAKTLYDVEPITANNIDFAKACKTYLDFWVGIETAGSLSSHLEKCNYYWAVPVTTGKAYYIVNIARGLPLSDESVPYLTASDIQTIQENEGKWGINSIGYFFDTLTPYEYLQKYSDELGLDIVRKNNMYIVGAGPTKINGALILTGENEGYIKVIAEQKDYDNKMIDPIFDNLIDVDFFVEIAIENSKIPKIDENGALLLGSGMALDDYKNMLTSGDYFYKEFSGSAGFIVLIFSLSAICLMALCFITFNQKNKKEGGIGHK
jgi:hypothetical protein